MDSLYNLLLSKVIPIEINDDLIGTIKYGKAWISGSIEHRRIILPFLNTDREWDRLINTIGNSFRLLEYDLISNNLKTCVDMPKSVHSDLDNNLITINDIKKELQSDQFGTKFRDYFFLLDWAKLPLDDAKNIEIVKKYQTDSSIIRVMKLYDFEEAHTVQKNDGTIEIYKRFII